MHLAEILRWRTRPGAGLLLALTQRCPLRCAHCSTDSSLGSAEYDEGPFRRLVDSFRPDDRPELIFMSGGEPLLRPLLVAELASRARAAGGRSAVLSGMFFARSGSLPRSIRTAVAAVDHFSASLDQYHEREVDRTAVFASLRRIMDLVPAVSLHIASDDEQYIDALVADVRATFHDRVPMMVSRIQPTGRARTLRPVAAEPMPDGPCEFAAWPLVDYDGTVFACSRQSLVRTYRSDHLVLGHAARDSWSQLRRRTTTRPLLRAVRTIGPLQVAQRAGAPRCDGVCATCVTLPATAAAGSASPALELATAWLVGRQRPRDLAARWGAGRYAHLVELGQDQAVHPEPVRR